MSNFFGTIGKVFGAAVGIGIIVVIVLIVTAWV